MSSPTASAAIRSAWARVQVACPPASRRAAGARGAEGSPRSAGSAAGRRRNPPAAACWERAARLFPLPDKTCRQARSRRRSRAAEAAATKKAYKAEASKCPPAGPIQFGAGESGSTGRPWERQHSAAVGRDADRQPRRRALIDRPKLDRVIIHEFFTMLQHARGFVHLTAASRWSGGSAPGASWNLFDAAIQDCCIATAMVTTC